jgi:hypothetical protein
LSTAPERTAKNVPSDLNDDEGDAFERNDNKSGGSKRKEINSIRVPSTNGNMMPASGAAADEEEVVQAERPIGRWVARKKPKSKAADGVLEGPAFPEMAQARVRRAKK